MIRVILVVLFVSLSVAAFAADLPPGVTCEQVQANYAQWSHLSKSVIRVWLGLNGYSRAQIRAAEKCLSK